jgi:hypothetical protein
MTEPVIHNGTSTGFGPSTAYGVMQLLPTNKAGVEKFSNQLIASVHNGEVNPLQLKALCKFMEAVFEKVDKETRDSQLTEAGKYSEKKFNAYGFEIAKEDVGVKYDYLSTGDPIYKQRFQIFEEAKKQLEERAAFLKALKEPLTVVDDESGEVATIHPPLKKGTEGLKFYMK